jgi:uncharacterized protein
MHRTSDSIVDIRSLDRVPLRIVALGAKGRGVIAERRIEPGEIVERSPVIIVPEADRAAVDRSNVGNYIVMWEHGTTANDFGTGKGRAAIVLGFASLVNHSDTPNCDFVRHIEALALDLFTVRTIEAGEELTIDYGTALWFTPG